METSIENLNLRKAVQEVEYVIDVRLSGPIQTAEFLAELVDFRGVFYDADLVTDQIWSERSTPAGHVEISVGHKFDNLRDANNFFDDIKMFLVQYRDKISGSITTRQFDQVIELWSSDPERWGEPWQAYTPEVDIE